MPWYERVRSSLKASDVDFVAYLPDTTLWPLIERIEEDEAFEAVLVSREEEAVGVLGGAWLGGCRGALVCQSSGLANTFNALGSVAKPWGLPFLGIVSRRGSIGEHNKAHVPAGYGMPRLLDSIGIRNETVDGGADVESIVEGAATTAFSVEEPFVLLLNRTLTGGKA